MADVDAAGHGSMAEFEGAIRMADSDVARQLMAMHTGGQVRAVMLGRTSTSEGGLHQSQLACISLLVTAPICSRRVLCSV